MLVEPSLKVGSIEALFASTKADGEVDHRLQSNRVRMALGSCQEPGKDACGVPTRILRQVLDQPRAHRQNFAERKHPTPL